MRAPLVCVLAIASIGMSVDLGACGGGSREGAPKSPPVAYERRYSTPFLGDGDYDVGDGDADNSADNDSDAEFDYYDHSNESANRGYFHDRDDSYRLTRGRPVAGSEARAVAALVTRYYNAASRDDGQRACAMLLPSLTRSITDYSRTGIPYLRGSRTCAEAMARLFRHYKLSVPHVVDVRVAGAEVTALWGSRTMPAGYISLVRRRGTWAITAPVGSPLL